jgi:hypothetical protein
MTISYWKNVNKEKLKKFDSLIKMTSLTDLPDDDNPQQDTSVVPKWAYGIVAGGAAALAVAGVSTYHYVTKYFRQKEAVENAKEIENKNLGQITPRETTQPTAFF